MCGDAYHNHALMIQKNPYNPPLRLLQLLHTTHKRRMITKELLKDIGFSDRIAGNLEEVCSFSDGRHEVMKDIICSYCGHKFSAEENSGGGAPECPACGTVVKDNEDVAPRKSHTLSKQQYAGAGVVKKDCPNCGAPVDLNQTLCAECGFSWETGNQIEEVVRRRTRNRFLLVAGGALLLGMVLTLFVQQQLCRPNSSEEPDAVEEVATFEEEESQPPVLEAEVEISEHVAEIPVDTPSVSPEPPLVIDTSLPSGWEDPAKRKTWHEMKIRRQLDEKYPMLVKNEKAVLRRKTGRIHRGEYLGHRDGMAVLLKNGRSEDVPFKSLQRFDRIRCDREYREQLIRYELKRRLLQKEN